MNCPSCGHENPADSRFCLECGGGFGVRCPACGAELPGGARFCNRCGQSTRAGAAEAPGREPRAYTPKHLAEKILQSKSALEGERKQVTVLFADVKGSMDASEDLDPEEWHRIMDRFFQILADGVHRFEGTINQYTGDGIMALFGAPIAHEDHARRGCYAALQLGEVLREYADELRRTRGLSFSVRMGLNSGDVVVGKIGDDLRMDYTAQGHTVGLAARVEGVAAPDCAYVAESTANLVKGYFELRDLGEFDLKGVREPVRVYELQAIGKLRTRLDLSRARGFSRFVGRASEMQALETALERSEQGTPQVVGIVGEAGVGKSRLCFEFMERCRARGLMTYETTGVAHGKSVPLLPMLRLFRGFFGIADRDSDVTAREKIAGRLLLLDERFQEALPVMFDFMGVADPERPAPRMDPEARQRQVVSITRGVVQARAGRETSVLLLEDLHWFDSASEAFLEPLVDAPPGARGLVVLNFRPEYRADWMKMSQYQQLPLLPLGPEDITELLTHLLGDDPSLASLAELIRERTGGNPFFIEEVVQSLAESGSLEGTRGSYRLATPIERLAIPDTVRAILSARIDRLAEREKRVLQSAAVIGKEFSEPILEAVAELPRPELAAALQKLKSTEFVYEQSLYPVAEYVFKHPLTQEVALHSQLQERRRRLHAAVAGAIERAFPERLDEQAALLAHHWEEAGEVLQAARWHRRAAEWVGRSDPVAAVGHWQRVRELGRDAPDTEEAASLRLDACTSILVLGGWRMGISRQEADAIRTEGEELAARLGDSPSRALLLVAYGIRLTNWGELERYVEHAQEADRLVAGLDDLDRVLGVKCHLGYSYWLTGRLEDAFRMADEVGTLTGGDPSAGVGAIGYSAYGWCIHMRSVEAAWLGRIAEAVELNARAIRFARENEHAEVLGWALGAQPEIAFLAGDGVLGESEEVVRAAVEALEIAEQLGSPFSRGLAYQELGRAQLLCNRPDQAISLLEQSRRIGEEYETTREFEACKLALLSLSTLARGNASRAAQLAREAVAAADSLGTRHWGVLGCLALARALLANGERASASAIERALDRGQSLVERSGARGLEPQILEARSALARLRGDANESERRLREAQRLFAAIGATGHAERVARELAEPSVGGP